MKTIIYYLSIIFICCFICCCSQHKTTNKDQNNTLFIAGNIHFNSTMDSLLRLFVQKADCIDCYYEIFIDKRYIDYVDKQYVNHILISLRASLHYPSGINDKNKLTQNYLNKKNPILYTKINNVIMFIYTGMEDIIIADSYNNDIEFSGAHSSYYEYVWTINIIGSEYTVDEGIWEAPYSPIEYGGIIKFVIPDSTTVK